jgi:glycerophosphoryl diester phosphodiesterase
MSAEPRAIQVHGHRGARGRLPENSIPAFRYAIEQGVDFIELDVAVTKDYVPVVSHDPHLNPAIGTGPAPGTAIHNLTLTELNRCFPTLDEVFALARGNLVQFNVEIKIFADQPELTPGPAEFTKLILDLIRRHGIERRVMLQSFDPRILRAIITLDAAIPRGALFETERDWMEMAREFEANILGPDYRLVTPARVSQAHAAGLAVVPWTVNKPEDWTRLAEAGVDGMITDDPATLIAWLKSKGLRF